jgi:hypothetical protein
MSKCLTFVEKLTDLVFIQVAGLFLYTLFNIKIHMAEKCGIT